MQAHACCHAVQLPAGMRTAGQPAKLTRTSPNTMPTAATTPTTSTSVEVGAKGWVGACGSVGAAQLTVVFSSNTCTFCREARQLSQQQPSQSCGALALKLSLPCLAVSGQPTAGSHDSCIAVEPGSCLRLACATSRAESQPRNTVKRQGSKLNTPDGADKVVAPCTQAVEQVLYVSTCSQPLLSAPKVCMRTAAQQLRTWQSYHVLEGDACRGCSWWRICLRCGAVCPYEAIAGRQEAAKQGGHCHALAARPLQHQDVFRGHPRQICRGALLAIHVAGHAQLSPWSHLQHDEASRWSKAHESASC